MFVIYTLVLNMGVGFNNHSQWRPVSDLKNGTGSKCDSSGFLGSINSIHGFYDNQELGRANGTKATQLDLRDVRDLLELQIQTTQTPKSTLLKNIFLSMDLFCILFYYCWNPNSMDAKVEF